MARRRSTSKQRKGLKQLTELRKLLRDVGEGHPEMVKQIRSAVDEASDDLVHTMKSRAPVDDGDLRNSITKVVRPDGFKAYVGPGMKGVKTIQRKGVTPFNTAKKVTKRDKEKSLDFSDRVNHDRFQFIKAFWLEFGTKKMTPRPFVLSSVSAVAPDWDKKIERAVNTSLKRISKGYFK